MTCREMLELGLVETRRHQLCVCVRMQRGVYVCVVKVCKGHFLCSSKTTTLIVFSASASKTSLEVSV